MTEVPFMTLDDFQFNKTEVDPEKIKSFTTEDQFMDLGVELFKEISIITSILVCTYRMGEDNRTRDWWKRDEAILGGLMVRLNKLQLAFLDQICNHKAEIAFLLHRSIVETIINLKYLMSKKDEETYTEYVKDSLKQEKRLLSLITSNIQERGLEEPIETRMKGSIAYSFETSSITIEEINESKGGTWGGGIWKRAKDIGMDLAYSTMFSLGNHAIHGNWQDLLNFHLNYEDGKFFPNTDWMEPRPQLLFAPAILCGEINKMYLDDIMPECTDVDRLHDMVIDIQERSLLASQLHEDFLAKAMND